jgi:hypothetical protein
LTPDGQQRLVQVGVFVFIGHLTGRPSG